MMTRSKLSDLNEHPFAQLGRLNGRFGRGYDAAPAELKPTILAVTELEHQARTARK